MELNPNLNLRLLPFHSLSYHRFNPNFCCFRLVVVVVVVVVVPAVASAVFPTGYSCTLIAL